MTTLFKKRSALRITLSILSLIALLGLAFVVSSNNRPKKSGFLTFNTSKFSNQIAPILWNSREGLERLNRSQYKNDFYQLANYYQPQINPLYCGVASAVMVLNAINAKNDSIPSQKALEVRKPRIFGGDNMTFNSYSQLTFLNAETDKLKDRKIIELQNITPENEDDIKAFDAGFTLDQLNVTLSIVYHLKTNAVHVTDVSEESINKFRNSIKQIAASNNQYLLANFDGKAIGAKTNGHISPIVAYDEQSDSVLVMDVALHKNPWYWVDLTTMVKSMNTKDGANYRGYLIITE